MVASEVKITPETRAKLDNQALSPGKKRELRENLIKECIRSAVGGMVTKQELVAAAGYNPDAKSRDYARGFGLINSMVKRGIICNDNANKFRKAWTVVEDVHIVTPTPAEVAAELVVPQEIRVELQEFEALTSIELVAMAKEFAWQKNSDSLREFIDYAKNAIK